LPIRSTGSGLLGCGLPSQDGVELLEALKWAGETLNHKEGENDESFIPGVKLGKCSQLQFMPNKPNRFIRFN
jgi:hypothetical protein